MTAGESDNPEKSMPSAIKSVFWRILLFYILSIAVISAILPYTDPLLLNKSESVAQSPFTIVLIESASLLQHLSSMLLY